MSIGSLFAQRTLIVATMLSLSSVAAAVEGEALAPPALIPPGPSIFLETDPATFALGGFAIHLRAHPAALPRWSFGAGAYGLNLPTLMVAIDPNNRDEGWSSRITSAGALFIDRYFNADANGAFVGVQIGLQHFRVARQEIAGEAEFTNFVVMPRVGYLWRPFNAGFYVMPWLGIGATARVHGEVWVGGEPYHILPVIAFATLHAGWSF